MPLPGTKATFSDGGLGVARQAPTGYVKIGVSSLGTVNGVYSATDPNLTKASLGAGPLVASTCYSLDAAGGPVYAMRVAASNVGTVGTVTRTGSGPTPGAAFTGNPNDDMNLVVLITLGGAVGTARFKISFDGGDTYYLGGAEFATAASVTLFVTETGLTVTFVAGTYVAGDTYTATATGPTYSASDLNAALDALKPLAQLSYRFIHITGTVGGADDTTKVSNFVALAAAVDVKLAALEAAGIYKHAIMEVPDVADAALAVAGITGFSSRRVGFVGGYAELINSAFNRVERRHAGTVVAARKAMAPRYGVSAAWVDLGSLPGIVKLLRDENASPLWDDLRITTLRTMSELEGFYITNDRLMAPIGSDFTFAARRMVADEVAAAVRRAAAPQTNGPVPVDRKTGFIDERFAKKYEKRLSAIARATVVATNNATAAEVVVVRGENILSTDTVRLRTRTLPFGSSRFIEIDVGLQNPAIQEV